MNIRIPDYIEKALIELERAIRRDNFNLTRDIHDAISVKILELRDFIESQYGK